MHAAIKLTQSQLQLLNPYKLHNTQHNRSSRTLRAIHHIENTQYTNKPKTVKKRNRANELTTTLSQLATPYTTWIRDLTEEGIEPNPGPRYVTKNVNGIQGAGKLYQCCKAIASEHQRHPITALFIQEHNLKQTDSKAHEKIARGHQLLILIAYALLKPNQSVLGGAPLSLSPTHRSRKNRGNPSTTRSPESKNPPSAPHTLPDEQYRRKCTY